MSTFTIKIDLGNAAFEPTPYPELSRILREIADKLDSVTVNTARKARMPEPLRSNSLSYEFDQYPDGGWPGHYQTIRDINGNDVGRFAIKEVERTR